MGDKKFRRASGSTRKNTEDAEGKVRIQIVLVERNPDGPGVRAVRGNISRSITVEGTVGAVASAIENAILKGV